MTGPLHVYAVEVERTLASGQFYVLAENLDEARDAAGELADAGGFYFETIDANTSVREIADPETLNPAELVFSAVDGKELRVRDLAELLKPDPRRPIPGQLDFYGGVVS